jgi:hypothetical protein
MGTRVRRAPGCSHDRGQQVRKRALAAIGADEADEDKAVPNMIKLINKHPNTSGFSSNRLYLDTYRLGSTCARAQRLRINGLGCHSAFQLGCLCQ